MDSANPSNPINVDAHGAVIPSYYEVLSAMVHHWIIILTIFMLNRGNMAPKKLRNAEVAACAELAYVS